MEIENLHLQEYNSISGMEVNLSIEPQPEVILKDPSALKHNTRYIENFELEEYELVKGINEDNKNYQQYNPCLSYAEKLMDNFNSSMKKEPYNSPVMESMPIPFDFEDSNPATSWGNQKIGENIGTKIEVPKVNESLVDDKDQWKPRRRIVDRNKSKNLNGLDFYSPKRGNILSSYKTIRCQNQSYQAQDSLKYENHRTLNDTGHLTEDRKKSSYRRIYKSSINLSGVYTKSQNTHSKEDSKYSPDSKHNEENEKSPLAVIKEVSGNETKNKVEIEAKIPDKEVKAVSSKNIKNDDTTVASKDKTETKYNYSETPNFQIYVHKDQLNNLVKVILFTNLFFRRKK